MTTRPASSDPADVAAYQEERARLREEKEFRERASEFFGESRVETRAMREDITALRCDMAAHEQRDRERFASIEALDEQRKAAIEARLGAVNLSIDSNDRKFYWIVGIGVGAVGVVALVGLYLTMRGTP